MRYRFFTFLLPSLLYCFNAISQEDAVLKSIINEIDFIKMDADSNSTKLSFYYTPHESTELKTGKQGALSIASINGSESAWYFSEDIYLEPDCRKICFAHTFNSEGDSYDDDYFLEKESFYYFKDKVLIKKIDKTRSSKNDDDDDDNDDWKVNITYPNEKETYKDFDRDLRNTVSITILREDFSYCDE
jgi:hypothetical protein